MERTGALFGAFLSKNVRHFCGANSYFPFAPLFWRKLIFVGKRVLHRLFFSSQNEIIRNNSKSSTGQGLVICSSSTCGICAIDYNIG